MRSIWITSTGFDINRDGLQFVTTILGFLLMNEEQLEFDTSIITGNNQRYIKIQRDNQTECLVLDELMKRAPQPAGKHIGEETRRGCDSC
jgi:protein kinase-like protein